MRVAFETPGPGFAVIRADNPSYLLYKDIAIRHYTTRLPEQYNFNGVEIDGKNASHVFRLSV